jgi:hypothetical protein
MILSSIFRNATSYIPRWIEQVVALSDKQPLTVVVAEGDSTDQTGPMLRQEIAAAGLDGTVLTVNHGGPEFDPIDDPKRWYQIAHVCNTVMACVAGKIHDDDEFMYVESDLVWPVDMALTLLDDLEDYPAVAPMSMSGPTGQFYDIWGHVKDGECFTWNPPYHPGLNGTRFTEIDSAGSCFVTSGRLARKIRFSSSDCIRGIGRDLRKHGASLWLDTSVETLHP